MRMIDADRMLSELKPITYDMEQNAVTIADMSNIMRNWVMRQPTIPAYGQWIKTADRLPKLPDADYCSVWVITYLVGDINAYPMKYERSIVKDKRVERWRYCWNRLANYAPDYWMPLPELPDERYKCRYADDNGVCSKLSGNGEIIYCVEGPCPYVFEEVEVK